MFKIIEDSLLFYEYSLYKTLSIFDKDILNISLILKLDDLLERDDNMKLKSLNKK